MDYAELKEWEIYFSYEPTMADRMETQLSVLMQMVSSFVYKEPKPSTEFMICPKKRPIIKEKSVSSKTKDLWAAITKTLGVSNE